MKQLLKEFEKKLYEEVDLGDEPKDVLPPLDKIEFPIYKANQNIDDIINNLSKYDTTKLQKVLKIISKGETAVDNLLMSDFDFLPYRHAGAKIVFAGEMLDDLLENKILDAEKEFSKLEKELNKKGTKNSLDNIKNIRKEISNILQEYVGLEKIYLDRGFPIKSISKIDKKISEYAFNLEKSKEIEEKIIELKEHYQNIETLKELKNIQKESSKGLVKGKLVKESGKFKYYEGLIKLKTLNEEVKKIRKDFNHYSTLRNSLQLYYKSNIEKIKRIEAIKRTPNQQDLKFLKELKDSKPVKFDEDVFFLNKDIQNYFDSRINVLRITNALLEGEAKQLRTQSKTLKEPTKENAEVVYNNAVDLLKRSKILNDYETEKAATETILKVKKILEKSPEVKTVIKKEIVYKEKPVYKEVIVEKPVYKTIVKKEVVYKQPKVVEKLVYEKNNEIALIPSTEVKPIHESSENFLLPSYVWDLGMPDNFRFYKIRNLLISGDGLKTWRERFSRLKEIFGFTKIDDEGDYNYLSGIAEGLKKAVTDAPPLFDKQGANTNYICLKEMLQEYTTLQPSTAG